MAVHAGSWFGLPDFGITEKIQSIFAPNTSLTSQNGSNLFGGSQAASTSTAPQGVVQYSSPIGPTLPTSGTGTNTGYVAPVNQTSGTSGPSPEELYRQQMEGSINSGWDSYENQLNSMLNVDLPGYQTQQQQIAQNSANLAIQQAGTQKASSEQAVNQQQASNLKDLGSNMKNLFQAGNIYLGSRGAGDSSAANQYSYALTKVGAKERANILSQVSSRMNQIKDIYGTEVNRIGSELNTRMGQIADWFYTQQQNLKGSLANAGLNRQKDLQALSTNLYNQALSYLSQVQGEAASRRQTLETWAANNATSIQDLQSKMQAIQQMPAFQGLQTGMPSVDSSGNYNFPVAAGYGATSTDKYDLYGNKI